MQADKVVEKILSEANAEADKIKAEAQAKADKARAEVQSELEKYNSETAILAKAAGEDRLARMLATARMETRKLTLGKKVELIDEVFDEALQQVLAMDESEYQALMSEWLTKAVETGDEEVIIGENETKITHDFIKQMNRELGSGYKGNLALSSDKADIAGGFILRRGKIQVNVSLEVLFSQVRENLEMELTQKLFGQE